MKIKHDFFAIGMLFFACACSSCVSENKKKVMVGDVKVVQSITDTNHILLPVPAPAERPIIFELNLDLPKKVPLNISFTFNGKTYKYYGHGMQYSEIDGGVFTEFSINGEIFPETSYDYGEGPLPDGISIAVNDSAVLNRKMQTDNDKTFLKIRGVEYKQEEGSITITHAEKNIITGSFTMAVHTKEGKLVFIDDGSFTSLPVVKLHTENE